MSEQLIREANYFITSITSVLNAFAFWQTGKHSLKINQKRNMIKQLEVNEVIDVQQLKHKGKRINDVVLIKGAVSTKGGKQIEACYGQRQEKLAFLLKYKENIYSNDIFDRKRRSKYSINMKQILEICQIEGNHKITLNTLNESQDKIAEVQVKNFDQKDYTKAMEILRWEEHGRDISLMEYINVVILGIFRILAMPGSNGKEGTYIKGLNVGQRSVDAGIKIGATISVLGTVGFTTDGEIYVEALSIFKDKLPQLFLSASKWMN